MTRLLKFMLRGAIRLYQIVVSPLIGPRCRYAPTCSEYAMEAITTHGPFAGVWLATKRIARCHPWGGSGYDPVPALTPCAHDHSSARHSHSTPHLSLNIKN